MPDRAILYEKTACIANSLSFVLASSATPHSTRTWKAASLRFRRTPPLCPCGSHWLLRTDDVNENERFITIFLVLAI